MKIDPTKLVEARLARSMSQEEAAMAADLSVRTVQRIEAGHHASLESTKALLTIFGTDIIHDPDAIMEFATAVPRSKAADWLIIGPGRVAGHLFDGLRYGLVALLLVSATFKPIMPGHFGFFQNGNTRTLSLFSTAPVQGQELLGLWFSPALVAVAGIILFSIRRIREAALNSRRLPAKA